MEIDITRRQQSRTDFTHGHALAAVLSARGVVNVSFTIWLLTQHPAWTEIFRAGSMYGLVDGGLGLVSVALLLPRTPTGSPPLLRVTTLFDAIVRLAVALSIRAFPGIPDTPITVMLFFSLLVAYAASLGVISTTMWLVAHAHWKKGSRAWRPGTGELFDPFAIAGVATLAAIGYAVRFGPPASDESLGFDAAVVCAVFGVAFLVSAAGALRRARIANDKHRAVGAVND